MTIQTIPTGAALGAEVKGVDLTKPMTRETYDEVEAALAKYAMIFFRGQSLTIDQQEDVIKWFGPPMEIKGGDNTARIKNPHFYDVSNVDNEGEIMSPEDSRRIYLLANQLWHADMSPFQPPSRVSCLHAVALPKINPPDTQFVDNRNAYDRLSDDMKKKLDGLKARHTVTASRRRVGYTDFSEWGSDEAVAGSEHALVRVHAGSGRKNLYMGAHADTIVGMPPEEGRKLLQDLVEFATQPELIYSHKWQPHDLVIWDNSCAMHRATPYDDKEKRELRWCTASERAPV